MVSCVVAGCTDQDLNLIRSVRYPRAPLDADRPLGAPRFGFTDQCEHTFTYSLLPHEGDHVAGGVSRAAYQLNVPLQQLHTGAPTRTGVAISSLCVVEGDAVVIEAIKAAEDGSGDVIVRL